MKILSRQIIKSDTCIKTSNGDTVMHEWETPIMQQMVNFICQDGGHILEIGFGMGIAANFIQQHPIQSHHIIELHPDIQEDLIKWAKDKENVKILLGDWYLNKSQLGKYDGILFDTHLDKHASKFGSIIPKICNINCKVTWWNNLPKDYNEHNLSGTTFDILHVNPPKNDYFNHKVFHMPKYIHNG